MKKTIQFARIFSVACGIVMLNSCDRNPVEVEQLDDPSGLRVEALTATSARLVWKAVHGASGYNLSVDGGPSVPVDEASYHLTGLAPETAHTWRVQAARDKIESKWTDGPGFTTPEDGEEPVTAPPTDLKALYVTHREAALTWTHPDADSHEVEVGDAGAVASSGAGSHPLTDLTPETTYTWRVRSSKSGVWSEWAEGPAFVTDAAPVAETPDPTDLAATGVTHQTATLTWAHPDADSHEVIIGEGAAVTVDEAACNATGLTPETGYTWKVRSAKGGVWSKWVEGPAFTTTVVPVQFPCNYSYAMYSNGDRFGWGTNNLFICLLSFDPAVGPGQHGWEMRLDIVATGVDDGTEYFDMPARTYDYDASHAPNTFFVELNEFSTSGTTNHVITAGTMTTTGDHTCPVVVNLTLGNGSSFVGLVDFYYVFNEGYVPDFDKLEFGQAIMLEYGGSDLKRYNLNLYEPGVELVDRCIRGYRLTLDMYAPGTSNSIIPDGTYTLGYGGEWTMKRDYSWLLRYKYGWPYVISENNIVGGTVTTTRTGEGTYTVVTDLSTASGLQIKKTYSGPVTSMPPIAAPRERRASAISTGGAPWASTGNSHGSSPAQRLHRPYTKYSDF